MFNVTATAINSSSFVVKWISSGIPTQLKLHGFRIKYCAWRLNGKEFDDYCLLYPCEEINTRGMQAYLTNLRGGTKYQIRVQATNLSAVDGTVVKYPDANFSESINGKTHEGGNE